ncbi:tRNA threonylcarbamoyladenosine biosynthesis protein TsaE [Tissierella praeacuta DSM 18095]|uniref:tRNA threonylcarbamoyladenosine biosynthesis protein TsaE n=1 Tax=Tissierella praeacuta DSM 18095 TaxID=1123404 RepID=A0A1M4XQ02_9FIRM|nr:tRNA (adenosine(37)-N6)-threonylcarbamoyltransferase complex ATPase subunit type 1 TsaE [Tissierella praeacuta]TCU75471.1 tRNA threonylcarbamoyladenosine biosynthesis protein TsaE [Tissierella praeacuta]SHE95353.1 tRNA threonylcarbamoyladenosine biosynthesis protein TsaE [Tissierella praeacuta DSM 18095]SUO99783.1 ADP-binding protein [Tissierella praeacuta]
MEIRLEGLEETKEMGIKLGNILKSGDIVCLNGELGAGKTTLTKSIGLGLGVTDYITSPTFALINEYNGRVPVYHFDVYRLENVEEIYDLGFDEYFYGKGVCIIEWAEKIERLLPKERVILDIEKGKALDERIINIKGSGNRYIEILKELEKN